MEPFATIEDVQARWHILTDDERSRVSALLVSASSIIRLSAANAGIEFDLTNEDVAEALRSVTCSMVIRVLMSDPTASGATSPIGASAASWTAGPFSQSATFSNPTGDLYLTAAEKSLLGLGGMRLGSVRVAIHRPNGDEVPNW